MLLELCAWSGGVFTEIALIDIVGFVVNPEAEDERIRHVGGLVLFDPPVGYSEIGARLFELRQKRQDVLSP